MAFESFDQNESSFLEPDDVKVRRFFLLYYSLKFAFFVPKSHIQEMSTVERLSRIILHLSKKNKKEITEID